MNTKTRSKVIIKLFRYRKNGTVTVQTGAVKKKVNIRNIRRYNDEEVE